MYALTIDRQMVEHVGFARLPIADCHEVADDRCCCLQASLRCSVTPGSRDTRDRRQKEVKVNPSSRNLMKMLVCMQS
jgi:hypothetical protein